MEKIIEGGLVEGVLYVYRCPACGHRGEVRHLDDSHDGAAASCAQCYGPVMLEWDGGVTLEVAPRAPVAHPPTAAELVGLRTRHGRTQVAVAERSGVTPRQVQRWEAGVGTMPIASWQLLCREWGTRFREDFATAPGPMTRGWDAQRDVERTTIERGDVVHLQAIGGPLIAATVCVDLVHDGLVDEHAYGAIVTGLGAAYPACAPLESFTLGERVSFARDNVIHLEQCVPRGADGRVTLHAAIVEVLTLAGHGLTASAIADEVNRLGHYHRADRAPVSANQIAARVNVYAYLFVRQDQLIDLPHRGSAPNPTGAR